MTKKPRSPKFKGKHFVSVIGKFQFDVPSGNTGLRSLPEVSGLTQFLRIRCSFVNCLCDKLQVVSNTARMCIVEHYFRTQSYPTVKHSYQVYFSDATVPNKEPR
jgi:hypothetical protein